MDRNYSKIFLSRERAFLFLSIIVITTLLTGFPQNLRIFVFETSDIITGGVVAVPPAELKDYLIGLVIFVMLVSFFYFIISLLRNPKIPAWAIHDSESLDADHYQDQALENDLEKVNRNLRQLRSAKEPLPVKKSRKITKTPNITEMELDYDLRRITAQLHGYKKIPLVLEAPEGKSQWDASLEEVKRELAGVDKMKFKKVKVRKTVPLGTRPVDTVEQSILSRELRKLSNFLLRKK